MGGTTDAGAPGAAIDLAADLYTVPRALEETLVDTVKALALTVPPPRYDPFYGLDRMDGPSVRLLDRLTRHGDFRKYVSVLDAGGGFGGPARWVALRYGCRVTSLDGSSSTTLVAAHLTRRARLADRVTSVIGSFDAIPVRDATFTQIWSVEALHHAPDRGRALRELFRVLRPGSPLALQEVVRRDESVPAIGGIWRHGTTAEYLDALAGAGFAAIESDDVTRERPETSPVVLSARSLFERLLLERLPDTSPWRRARAVVREVKAIVATPDYTVVQLFARRPSI